MRLSALYTHGISANIILEKERSRKNSESPGFKKHEQTPFAKAIKDITKDQEEVADSTDVHPSTVSRWKSGVRKPRFDNLKKVGRATGKRLSTLFPTLK